MWIKLYFILIVNITLCLVSSYNIYAQTDISELIVVNKGRLQATPGFGSNKIRDIEKGQKVSFTNEIYGDYYKVTYIDPNTSEKYEGYMHKILLSNDVTQDDYVNIDSKTIELERNKLAASIKMGRKREMLIQKYGETLGIKLSNAQIELGMTKEMVLDALGKPYINKMTDLYNLKTVKLGFYDPKNKKLTTTVYLQNDLVIAMENFSY